MAVSFDTLNPNAPIFKELSKGPSWWVRFKNDPSLYIEIRKDNQVNVYFEGGSIARIHYCSKHKKLQIFTHHKYLNLPAPSKGSSYIECSSFIDEIYNKKKRGESFFWRDFIMERVKSCYSQKHNVNGVNNKEKWSEKFIQGLLIVNSRAFHLDSEFAYNDSESKNRIDFIRCDEGIVSFVELKRMSDGRMLHKDDKLPEIIEQMERYHAFIERYSDELLRYYQTLYDIKQSLGLPIPKERPTAINPEPHLLIFDCWEKDTSGRDTHRKRLAEILQHENIDYSIKNEFVKTTLNVQNS